MSDESLHRHKTYTIRLMSYPRDGEWVPLALVSSTGQREEEGHPVSGEVNKASRTRDAADAIAKKLAIEWIDSQFPSAAD